MRAVVLGDLDLQEITLVCQDWGGLIGLRLVGEHPERFARVVAANTFLPTGDQPPGQAFLNWQRFSQTVEDFDVGFIVGTGCHTELPTGVVDAYRAPYPDDSYKAGARQFPMLVPTSPDDPASAGEPDRVGDAARMDKAVPHRILRRGSRDARRRPRVPTGRARVRGPTAHNHRGRGPLPAGRLRRAARPGRRGLDDRQVASRRIDVIALLDQVRESRRPAFTTPPIRSTAIATSSCSPWPPASTPRSSVSTRKRCGALRPRSRVRDGQGRNRCRALRRRRPDPARAQSRRQPLGPRGRVGRRERDPGANRRA